LNPNGSVLKKSKILKRELFVKKKSKLIQRIFELLVIDVNTIKTAMEMDGVMTQEFV